MESFLGMSKLISHMEKILKAFEKLGKKVGFSSDSESDEGQRSSRRGREVRPKRKSGEFKKPSEPRVRFPDYSPSRESPRYNNRGGKRWEISISGLLRIKVVGASQTVIELGLTKLDKFMV